MINHIFVKLSIQFISGFVISIRDTLNYYTSIYHTLNFIFSFIHQSSEKESQFPPSPCSYFFFIRGCHISSFLFFESPVRCPRTKRVHGNVTEREIKASREKIAISRRSDVALYHHGNGPFSFETDVPTPLSPEFLNPMPAIMVGAKNADTVLSSAKKRAGNVNFIYSIQFPRARPSKGWPTFISSDFFFSFPFFRGEERIDGRSL